MHLTQMCASKKSQTADDENPQQPVSQRLRSIMNTIAFFSTKSKIAYNVKM